MRKVRIVAISFAYVASLVLVGQAPRAVSTGITGFSGAGGSTCNVCHFGGSQPAVAILGPTSVTPGSTHTYTLRITRQLGGGLQIAGGLDVSTNTGSLAVSDPGTYLAQDEITHVSPRPIDGQQVTFTFNWTAPATPGSATLYGSGNLVNLNGSTSGDRAAAAALSVAVAATPGEASAPTQVPLLVTGYDRTTGDIAISYDPACESTDTNIYFGDLADVSSWTWSGADCAIGTSGAYAAFDPGAGSYFFVVVGTRDGDEGSYGTAALPDGTTPERVPFAGNECGQAQNLEAACSD